MSTSATKTKANVAHRAQETVRVSDHYAHPGLRAQDLADLPAPSRTASVMFRHLSTGRLAASLALMLWPSPPHTHRSQP
jgi:hypothetical protein